ncbi:flagellar hook-length control protein FliK [Amphritea sp. HPY]|uniref:flagellar hook-length control protein FliK n=1 Tax=Amphritea sp. HPY TaxID=3421652 RepID=UPI003D7D061F
MNQSLPVSAGIGSLLSPGNGAGRPDGAAVTQPDIAGFDSVMGHAAAQSEAKPQSGEVSSKVGDGEGLPVRGDSLPESNMAEVVSTAAVEPGRSVASEAESIVQNVAATVAQISGFREADLGVSGGILRSAAETPAALAVQERIAALALSEVVDKTRRGAGDGTPLAAESLAADSALDSSALKGAVSAESASPVAGLNSPLDKGAGQRQSSPADTVSPELAVRRVAEAFRHSESSAAVKPGATGQTAGVEQSVVDPVMPSATAHEEALLAAVQRGNEQLAGQSQQVAAIDTVAENIPGAAVGNVTAGGQQGGRDVAAVVDSVAPQVSVIDEQVAFVAQPEEAQAQSQAVGQNVDQSRTSATDIAQPLSQGTVVDVAPVDTAVHRDIAGWAAIEPDSLQRSGSSSQALESRSAVVSSNVVSTNAASTNAASTVAADSKPLGEDTHSQPASPVSQKLAPGSQSEQALKQTGDGLMESVASEANTKNLSKTQALAESFAASLANSTERAAKVATEPQVPTLPNGVKPGMPAWNQAINERIMMLSSQNGRFVEIQLDPPELGSLQVKLQLKNDQVSVVFNTPHGSVREALEQGMPKLREMFEEQGLNLADSSVEDQGAGQSGADQEGESQQAASSYGEFDSGSAAESVTGVEQASLSLVDYYA